MQKQRTIDSTEVAATGSRNGDFTCRDIGESRRYPTEMKTLISILIIVVSLECDANAQSVRVATYNLNYANRRGDQVLEAIAAAKPDLICFQETTQESERFLRDKLATEFSHFFSIGYQGHYAAERFAFASKLLLAELAFSQPTVGLFGFYSATATIGDKSVRIVNVHLTPVVLQHGESLTAAMSALSDAEAKHAAEIEIISKSIDSKVPTIVIGDFNSISTFIAPTSLRKLGLIDSFASVNVDADAHATWTWPTRPLPISLRIDYIFHTSHFTTTESTIHRRDGSDHFLVVSDLAFANDDGG